MSGCGKLFIRRKMLELRGKIPNLEFRNSYLFQNISSLITDFYNRNFNSKPCLLGLYSQLKGEPDLSKFLLDHHWQILLPKVYSGNRMRMVSFDSSRDCLVKGIISNILEPLGDEAFVPDIIVIPGVAFSIGGYRVGFGRGIYDKYLEYVLKANPEILILGVCFHPFLVSSFSHDPWDIKFHFIVTDQIILKL